jgi:hypothetical protein
MVEGLSEPGNDERDFQDQTGHADVVALLPTPEIAGRPA